MSIKVASKVDKAFTKMFIDKIVERRANGENVTAPWRKLWNPALGQNRNLDTNHAYRGGNIFMTAIQGFTSPFWATRKQIDKMGGEINRQACGNFVPYTPIVFWNWPDAEAIEKGRFPFVQFYQVWNVDQTTGLEALTAKKLAAEVGPPVNPIEAAQAIVDGYKGPVIEHGGPKACYSPGTDTVRMPDMQAFDNAEAYYHTIFHELTHSTGHRNRLDRGGVANPVRFASHDYSEEELIAEMGAGMLAGFAGIDTDDIIDNSATYLDHWLKKLKREPGMLSASGGQAQKAVDLIRGISWDKPEKAKK